ncbi:hypothetical protein BDQ12DRAFT_686654 [Crucibulum laeve]|uniref:F-box domain-containing protein n=1 Tax=Crucibulum laeve TaxID=68775 RepID=A0A5C3LVI9_9AGAR|nr:hypothetical protein BDQ12DRAFT_686654 [Crucibulum laeve]
MLVRLLDNTPPEIVQKIVLYATAGHLGPPKALHSMLLTCRTSYALLSKDSGEFYLNLFRQQFDTIAPGYRLGRLALREQAKLELNRRFKVLKLFRSKDISSPFLEEAFWIAYLMIEDSGTSQSNIKQLLHSGVLVFLDRFLRERLYEGSEGNNGWPLMNELNSLALALSWLLSSRHSLINEQPHDRDTMLKLLSPYVFAAFRYPIFSAHEVLFDISNLDGPFEPTNSTIHGRYPALAPQPRDVAYFGNLARKARVPSATIFACLLYFKRREARTPEIPITLKWQTRAQAEAAGHTESGPTREDFQHFVDHCETRFGESQAVDFGVRSRSLDSVLGQPAPYKLGTLTGCWQGSWIMVETEGYKRSMTELTPPKEFATRGRIPLYFTLQEHFAYDADTIVPRDIEQNGLMNAWLPPNCQVETSQFGVKLVDEHSTCLSSYETFSFDQKSSHAGRRITDVLITGKTDDRHAAAWGQYNVLGRVRLADGLMVLIRTPFSGGVPQILRGYVTSSQNLVGRLTCTEQTTGIIPPSYEAPFSLCKNNTTTRSTHTFKMGPSF